ncbi:MAG: hypothetical protein ACKPBV_24225 [Sphaerospermopsis kisseleviana]
MHINWHPSSREMRHWALIMAPALGFVGSLFYFVDWGIFAGGQGFAKFLWSFGALAFVTGITGTKLGMPAYWAWMGFVYVVSSIITYTALTLVYLGVVTPLALLARLLGRDRLQLRAQGKTTYWHDFEGRKSHDPERQF